MRSLIRMGRASRRRAAVAVYVAISMTTVMAMAALAVDMGALYTAKAELQRAADAAALAGASQLITGGGQDAAIEVIDAAQEVTENNPVLAHSTTLDTASDIELGQAEFDVATGKYIFTPSSSNFDAVRVTVRRESGSSNGPIQMMFARTMGYQTQDLSATAAAVLVPRDIAVVIDLSNSMCYDSQLRFWDRNDGGYANTRDVWAALDGAEPSRPYLPGAESETEYAGDTGPTFGIMSTWGAALEPGYSATSDSGLFYIRKGSTCSDPTVVNGLADRGYSAQEQSALLSGSGDSNTTRWKNRVCVLLGLVEWKSGKSGGKYGSAAGGDGDNLIENNELTDWVPTPAWAQNWGWKDYVDYAANTSVYKSSQTMFRYRYGLKTFTDFLLESHPESYASSNLWATPEQPLRAVKDAVQSMMDTIAELDSLDHVSLEVFASTARHEVNLSPDLQDVADVLYARQSGHYDRATNIAGGMIRAIDELTSARARGNAHKVIMLMSDGVANTDENGNFVGDGSAAAIQYALDRAEQAQDLGIKIHTVSVGYGVDRALMQEIAAIGKGQEFYAVGSPEEYSEQLEAIFKALGGKRPVALIE